MLKQTMTAIFRSVRTTAPLLALVLGACGQQDAGIGSGMSIKPFEAVQRQDVYNIETDHPYGNNQTQEWEIRAPEGTEWMKIHFARFETEQGYDSVLLMDQSGQVLYRLSGQHTGEEFEVEGDYVKVRFVSDYSITGWGFQIDYYTYGRPLGGNPGHKPECRAVGSRSEGWYWADTGELIKFANCKDAAEPHCGAIGTRSEGWYADGFGLVVWDNCHRAERIALEGEPCGPSIGFSCYDNLYCQGLPTDGRLGGTGTCRRVGTCVEDEDCSAEGNAWVHIMCVGYSSCENGQCTWHCGQQPEEGPWSWTTFLAAAESHHPYGNNERHTWTIHEEGATKIKIHFQRIDLEDGYDWIAVTADGQQPEYITGSHEDFWTREFDGDTVAITLHSDYSVTRWGFKVDQVSIYEQLPAGQCNRDEDCAQGEHCVPHQCFNAYAPCHGECVADNWDGTEGSRCDDQHPCNQGLSCKARNDEGTGTCHAEDWCAPETVASDCANLFHIEVPGFWTCEDNHCQWTTRPGPQAGDFQAQDTPKDIPDADPAGVTSEVFVGDFNSTCNLEVTVDLQITHTYRGDLRVVLEDPTGQTAVLWNRDGGPADDLVLSGSQASGVGTGHPTGLWKLHVYDLARYDTGRLESWTLHLRCQ